LVHAVALIRFRLLYEIRAETQIGFLACDFIAILALVSDITISLIP